MGSFDYAVLFDLDGVIIDTRKATSQALEALAAGALDRPVDPAALDQCAALAPVDGLIALGVQDACRIYEERFDRALTDAVGQLRVFQPVIEGIAALSARGIGLGIVTAQAHRRLPFLLPPVVADLVDVVIAHEDAAPKPAPDGILSALDQLDVSAARAVFIGDTPNDMAAGRSAGVRPIGVAWGFVDPGTLRRAGADDILTYPQQVGIGLLAHLDGRGVVGEAATDWRRYRSSE